MQLTPLTTASEMAMRREFALSNFIPYSHLVDANTFATKGGAIGSVIHLKGLPFEVTDDDVLMRRHLQIAQFVQSLSPAIAIYITIHRHKQALYPDGDFPQGFANDFNEAYRQKLAGRRLYANDIYITLMVKGPSEQGFKTARWFKKFLHKANDEALHHFIIKQRELLNQIRREALNVLAEFSPRLLGDVKSASGNSRSSALLGFLGLPINGTASPLAYPLMDLSHYLSTRRVSTHNQLIEWQGPKKSDTAFGALLSIKQYGHESEPTALRKLLSADFEYVSTHSFCREPNESVIDLMRKQYRHYTEVDPFGNSLTDSLEEATDALRSELLSFGWHHHTLMVLSDSPKHLQDHTAFATDIYRKSELIVVRESTNLEAGFFAQMPGNFKHIHRRALISNENLTDFCPLHNYHNGYMNDNHLGSALMLVESQGLTPLTLNFHKQHNSSNKTDPTLGHTLVIAPSGVGKTTLICALDAMSKKYNGRAFFFDRMRGCEIYVRAMGGFYTTLSSDTSTGFNPLQLPDTTRNREFLRDWLESLLSHDATIASDVKKQLSELVDRNYTLPKASRRLSSLAAFLPADFALRDSLSLWLRSTTEGKADGDFAYLFDNPEDTLDLENINIAGFDMTDLLKEKNAGRAAPVLLYLFYRMESLMTGELMGIYLDEAWQFLNTPYWVAKLEDYLATLRKCNVYIVFMTQFLDKILKSPLSSHLIDGAATQIFLQNDKAGTTEYIEGAKLSIAEHDFIKNKSAGRFLFKQGLESAIARLNLEGLEDFIRVFSTNETNRTLCATLRAEHGDQPAQWLPHFHAHFKEAKQ